MFENAFSPVKLFIFKHDINLQIIVWKGGIRDIL